jgi:hypothetical protein
MRVQVISRCRRAFYVLLVSLGVLRASAQSLPSPSTLLTIAASARLAAPLPEHKGEQVVLKLSSETVTVPRQAINIPPDVFLLAG